MPYRVPFRMRKPEVRHCGVDFDVGEPEMIEQSSFEIEEITWTGDHQVTIETELVPDITITGEHRSVAK